MRMGVERELMHTVTVDTCEDYVAETPPADCLSSVLRFVWIQGWWVLGRLDRTETATSCARIAH
jgi:hypothetical protein